MRPNSPLSNYYLLELTPKRLTRSHHVHMWKVPLIHSRNVWLYHFHILCSVVACAGHRVLRGDWQLLFVQQECTLETKRTVNSLLLLVLTPKRLTRSHPAHTCIIQSMHPENALSCHFHILPAMRITSNYCPRESSLITLVPDILRGTKEKDIQ